MAELTIKIGYNYVEAWRKRIESDEAARMSRFRQAREAAEHAARELVEHFGATRVYLIGSMLDDERFMMQSNMDLAVEGLDADKYFKAINRISDFVPQGVEIDLVPIEDAYDYIKESIFSHGVVLYERKHAHS